LTIATLWAIFLGCREGGRLAQRLERCVDIAEVTGSNPVSPTIIRTTK
jgi:hypothetical protein